MRRAPITLVFVLGVVAGACAGSTDQGPQPTGASGTTSSSLGVPLPPGDPAVAIRDLETNLRRELRERAELSKLGPGAFELAGLMDRTASFLLAQLPAKLIAGAPTGGPLKMARPILAAPLAGLPPPGAPVFGTYLMTTVLFSELAQRGQDGDCPCSKTANLDPTTDEVTVGANKGTITTTITATATVNGSKVSLDISMKVNGEVRDATTGAILYKIANQATGHADGDACPDASGVAVAHMKFGGQEDYFDANGAKTATRVSEEFGGELRFKVDDNARLSGVDLKTSGHGAEIMLRLAARSAAPAFEKAWRSGACIEVLVDPLGGDVDSDSETTITVKVKHKIEGNELDKPVEAKLTDGVKTIDPSGSKRKAPATFRYTAGSEGGDRGGVLFESVSNRGIGKKSGTFVVAGGWTISSVGTYRESVQGLTASTPNVSITDLKVSAGKDKTLSGSGTMTLSGPATTGFPPFQCRGELGQTVAVTASGMVVGTGPGAVLRLTLSAQAAANAGSTTFSCPGGNSVQIPVHYSQPYAFTLGEFDLPADGGTTTLSRTALIGGVLDRAATGTFTVVRAKR